MDNPQERKPLFWPAVFGVAFLVGGILWCVWMWFIVQKTRATRESGFFVPVSGQTTPVPANTVTASSNAPAPPTNPGTTTNLR